MEYTEFFAQIKQGGLWGAYLLHGTEEYVKQSALETLTQSVDAAVRDLNVQTLQAPTASELSAACETLPFFAKQRLIICRDLAAAEEKALSGYVDKVPETTILILYRSGKADGRSSLTQTLKKSGREVEFAPLDEADAARWLLQRARKLGALLEPPVARHLVTLSGTDIATLNGELNKAIGFAGPGQPVTREVLEACAAKNIEYQIFHVLDDLLCGRVRQGLQALYQMLRDRDTSPIPAAALLNTQCRQMLSAKALLESGMRNEKDIAARMGCKPFLAQKAISGAKRYSLEQLKRAVKAFSDVDYRIRSGQSSDLLALESAIFESFLCK